MSHSPLPSALPSPRSLEAFRRLNRIREMLKDVDKHPEGLDAECRGQIQDIARCDKRPDCKGHVAYLPPGSAKSEST